MIEGLGGSGRKNDGETCTNGTVRAPIPEAVPSSSSSSWSSSWLSRKEERTMPFSEEGSRTSLAMWTPFPSWRKHQTSRREMCKMHEKRCQNPQLLNPENSWILSIPKLVGMLADVPKLCPTSRIERAASRNPQVCDKLQRHRTSILQHSMTYCSMFSYNRKEPERIRTQNPTIRHRP